MPKYYMLAIKMDGKWSPEFGDYDRETVEQEKDSFNFNYDRDEMKIFMTHDDSQCSIDKCINRMNYFENLKSRCKSCK